MNPELRVIIIEDNPDDVWLVLREVEHAGYAVRSRRVQTGEELSQALAEGEWDLILADYSLPSFSATEALGILQSSGLDIPFIVVSGGIGEETAVALMRSGADDYVMKDRLARLGPAVQRELREAEERKNKRIAERALEASEKRYRTMVNDLPGFVYRCRNDPDWTMLFVSKGCEAVTGYPPGDLIENSRLAYASLIRPEFRTFVWQSVQEALQRRTVYEYEYPILVASGEPNHWVWERGRGVFSEDDELLYLEGFITDITDLRRAQAEKDALQAELQQSAKMEAIGQLAGGIAHDFNNLLTGMLGNVDLIRQELPASGPMTEELAAIERAARQAASLARGLLTFGRRAPIAPVSLDMVQATNNALDILKQSLPASIHIELAVDSAVHPVVADFSQITQIILNLGVNARDAMKGSGTIAVSLCNEVTTEKYVKEHPFARVGEFVHLAIADTGPGIPAQVREHLFEPFYTTKAPGSGTGLGLSIVYGIVKQAGGWITADSEPGRGATFDVFLPASSQQPAAAGPAPSPTVSARGRNVLVVEDEPQVAAVTEALLKRAGCQVVRASEGASALELLRSDPGAVDLVLLDMTMPGMTTDEIVAAIRDIDGQLPIVLTSGYTSGDTVSSMVEAGLVQAFLPKPYQSQELLDVVTRFARQQTHEPL